MDKPENVEHLSKNWKKDFAETIKKLFAMFMYGPMFFVGALISTYVLLVISNWVWAWFENVDFFDQIASLGLISLWCYVGYKSYEKRWWLIKGVLTHIFPAVMLLICNQLFDGKLSLFYGFAFVPYMLLGIGSFGEGDTYVWCLLANMIVFYFGMLLGKIVELCRECWTRRSLRTKSN